MKQSNIQSNVHATHFFNFHYFLFFVLFFFGMIPNKEIVTVKTVI